jgi:hypothetical protein
MKKQTSTQEDLSTKQRRRKRGKEQFFETVRAIQQDNKDADPNEVLRDVTEAVEAVRQEEYERETTRRP